MYIKFIDSENGSKLLRFFVNHSGVQWYIKRGIDEVIELVKCLAKTYHTADFFKTNTYRRFIRIKEDQNAGGVSLNDLISKVMMELTSLYVIRKDAQFKEMFEVDLHMRDENIPVNPLG